ncbi:MAG: hypothetical protein IT170_17145 [Bryobacterales bacterium]|nr:hypothetical protein [Bryobacterales bacterium]
MKPLLWILSIGALGGCLASAVMAFHGMIDDATYKMALLICSVLWFTISSARMYLPARREANPAER